LKKQQAEVQMAWMDELSPRLRHIISQVEPHEVPQYTQEIIVEARQNERLRQALLRIQVFDQEQWARDINQAAMM
jgi:uncharacterized membrane protein